MLRKDDEVTIYMLHTRAENYLDGRWFVASLDHFGAPNGFSASGECWQKHGVHGVLDRELGIDGLMDISSRHPDRDFRLVSVKVSQLTSEICVLWGANHE